jgi:hypothetical protein
MSIDFMESCFFRERDALAVWGPVLFSAVGDNDGQTLDGLA